MIFSAKTTVSLRIDDIQEELRREDFFNHLKKGLPWIVGFILLILMTAAGYTLIQWQKEKTLIQYEAVYQEALEKIENKDPSRATKLLKQVAKQCSGLRFAAQMTWANIHQKNLVAMVENQSKKTESHPHDSFDPTVALEERKALASCDNQVLSVFSDPEFFQFLSLCRFMLDAQQSWSYFGPSPVAHHPNQWQDSSVPVPLSQEDVSNTLNLYTDAPAWSALGMAIKIVALPKGEQQNKALKEWCKSFQSVIPLLTLMGLVEDFHS